MKTVAKGIQSVLIAILILLALITGVIIYYNVLRTDSAETALSEDQGDIPDTEGEPQIYDTEEETETGDETETEGMEEDFALAGESVSGETGHIHTYTELELKPATCTEEGEMEYICDLCDDSYREMIPMLDHTPGEWFTAREATASQTGLRQRICSVCGRTVEEEIIPVNETRPVPVSNVNGDADPQESAHEHTYTWEITSEATCTERGEKTFTCTSCGNTFTQVIPATNHPSRRTMSTEGDCGEPGTVETICNLCSAVISSETLYYDHTWSSWDTVNGKKTRRCEVCGETQTK